MAQSALTQSTVVRVLPRRVWLRSRGMMVPDPERLTSRPQAQVEARGPLFRGVAPTMFAMASTVLPLLLGGGIYILWRSPGLLMFRWLESFHLGWLVSSARGSHLVQSIRPAQWVLFSLPNALWVLSLVTAAGLLWGGTRATNALAVGIAALIGVGAEVAQALGLLPGTFSAIDLLTAVLAAAVGILLSIWRSRCSSIT